MENRKYVNHKTRGIVLFTSLYEHYRLANNLGFRREDIIGAGFFTIGVSADGKLDASCFGESISLNIRSKPEDTIALKLFLGIME